MSTLSVAPLLKFQPSEEVSTDKLSLETYVPDVKALIPVVFCEIIVNTGADKQYVNFQLTGESLDQAIRIFQRARIELRCLEKVAQEYQSMRRGKEASGTGT